MATISDLNVRLGLIYKDFDKSLSAVEKKLERSGRKFSQLGNDLALSVSLPLAALGASAIKQAGEIESLKLAMVSTFAGAGRSAQEATKEVEALRQAAMAPGLDFEQAVKGSIRLQGVGLAAEEARGILTNMANAIASTGGTAEDLDGVTKQFAQMISKGRVLQEDVSIISERMPVVARLMQQAFGTSSVEAIRNSGVSAKDFVARINEAAAALPKVEGGIKNALVNAAAEARNSLATLGETIVKAFDVTGKLDTFAKTLQGVVQWFQGLSDAAKSTIIQAGLFAVVLGPVIKIIGVIISTGGAAITVIKGIAAAIAAVAGGSLSAVAAFQALSLAMKLTVIGAAITAVTALYLAFNYLSGSMEDSARAAKVVAEVNDTAAKSIAEQRAQIGILTGIIQRENVALEQKQNALNRLKEISPEYYGTLTIAKGNVEGLTAANDAYLNSLLKTAKAQAAREKIVQIEREIIDMRSEGLGVTGKIVAAAVGEANAIAFTSARREKEIKALELQQKALGEVILENSNMATIIGTTTKKTQEQIEAERKAAASASANADERAKAVEKQKAALKAVEASIDAVNKKQAVLGSDFVGEKTTEIENGVEKLIEAGFGENSAPVQKLKDNLRKIREEIARGFGSQNKVQIEAGLSSAAPAALPTLAAPDQIASLNTGPAAAAVDALRSLQSAAIADIEAQKNAASSQDIARAERERVANSTSTQSIKAQIEDLKNLRLTSISEIERAQIDAQIAELERIAQEKAARQELQASVLSSAMDLATGIVGLKQAQGDAEKAQLDEEYAGKIEAAKGNADAQAKIQAELAAKKKAIDKKVGKEAQGVAIAGAVINTALGVSKALSSSPPPYNFILAALTAAAGAVQIATIKSQKFAAGGVITKPTYGLMGEYPGANRNPEIVTPERLMRSVFRDEMGAGGGQVQVYGTIRGSDIILSSERAAAERNRTR